MKARRILKVASLGAAAFIVAAAALTLAVLSTGQITAPNWVRETTVDRLKSTLGRVDVSVGTITVSIEPLTLEPLVHVHSISIDREGGAGGTEIADLRIWLELSGLLQGRAEPTRVDVRGIDIRLESSRAQAATGDPAEPAQDTAPESGNVPREAGQAHPLIEALSAPVVASLEEFTLGRIDFRDGGGAAVAPSVRDGEFTVVRDDRGHRAEGSFSVELGEGIAQQAAFLLGVPADSSDVLFRAEANDFALADVLGTLLDSADLTGVDLRGSLSLSAAFGLDGSMASARAEFKTGPGALAAPGLEQFGPLAIRSASASAAYDPDERKLLLESVLIDSDAARIDAEGYLYWLSGPLARPVAEGSIWFEGAEVSADGLFDTPVSDASGIVDFRLESDPLEITVSRIALSEKGVDFAGRGNAVRSEEGWQLSADFSAGRIPVPELFELWPLPVVPDTRVWLVDNLLDGDVNSVNGALRLAPGADPVLLVTFKFDGIELNYLGSLPPIIDGYGHGKLSLEDVLITLEAGGLEMASTGTVDMSGTTMLIPDVARAEVPSEFNLEVAGPIESVFLALNESPLNLLDKASIPVDFASGSASGAARISFPLLKDIALDDVQVEVQGKLNDVETAELVGGKRLVADELSIAADAASLSVAGSGRLGRVPLAGEWRQEFGTDAGVVSTVDGEIELSQAFLEEFEIEILDLAVQGSKMADLSIAAPSGTDPQFSISADLQGIGVEVPLLDWRKAPSDSGILAVEGTLAEPMSLDRIEFAASGLNVAGTARFREGGGLGEARIETLKVGDWLDIALEFGIADDGEPVALIRGGFLDARNFAVRDDADPGSEAAADEDPERPVSVALDRIMISESMELNGLDGEFTFGGGLSGTFTASVNEGARVSGGVRPRAGGSAIGLTADDAGEVLRSSGIIRNLHDGSFRLRLDPDENSSRYVGRLAVNDARARDMPALGELLNYLSVSGILEQLGGEGILFSTVEAEFTVGEDGIELTRGMAVGSAIGLTMTGTYDFSSSMMNMEGVVTPFYLINRIFSSITPLSSLLGIGRGEGIGAITYRMRGPSEAPSITVNPVSVLTPGYLGDIFRPPDQ